MKQDTQERDELVFLPLGGAGEIGMNLYAYGFGAGNKKKWLLVDMGVSFAGPREPGVNVVMPDISFLEERQSDILGLMITHAHEDHIGAVSHLWSRLKMPVYASPFASLMLKGRLIEKDIYEEVRVHTFRPSDSIMLGPFSVEPFRVIHSIPEACGFILRVGGKILVHTGDWRMDEAPRMGAKMDIERLSEIGEEGCDFLICDSTNVLSDKTSLTETVVLENLAALIKKAPARVLVTTFASNVGRLSSIIMAAGKAGREIILTGRAMERVMMLVREMGMLTDLPNFVPVEDVHKLPRDKVLILCTGSQGELRAQCARIAFAEHSHIELDAGDWALFSSKTIPGNERDVAKVENAFARQGVKVITSDMAPIHETGHPRQNELAALYQVLKPSCLIPMHGEARHLYAHVQFALSQGIEKSELAFNGDVLKLSPGEPEVIDQIPMARLFEDGNIIVSEGEGAVKRRLKLAHVGCVSISIIVTDRGDLVGDVRLTCEGLPEYTLSGAVFADMLLDVVYDTFDAMPKKRRAQENELSETIRRAVRKEANYLWGKKPVTHVLVSIV